jgi:uncharacterized protein with HEPN domain
VKDDRVYLKHILRCVSRIEEYAVGGRAAFMESHLIQDGVIRNLQTLAESSQRLDEDLKVSQPAVGLGFGTSRSTITSASISSWCNARLSATFPD